MALLHFLIDTPFAWQAWYVLLPPAYAILVFAPGSRLAERIFGSGLFLALPVAYLTLFAIVGTAIWELNLFRMLVSTSRDLGHLQVVAAFCVTATTADLTFASIFFRRYPDLPLPLKLFIAFWILMIGWLLGVAILLLVNPRYRRKVVAVRLGPFVIASAQPESR